MPGYITKKKLKTLELQANEIRQSIIKMLVAAGSGHTAGPLGMADIFTAFYFHILNHDPKKPHRTMGLLGVMVSRQIC